PRSACKGGLNVDAIGNRRVGDDGNRGRLWLARLDVRDEAEPALVDGSDQALRLSVIADRLAGRLHAARKRRLRHDAAVPDRLEKVVAADDPIAILHEVDEQREDLRLDRKHGSAAAQLLSADVDLERIEAIE